MTIVIPSLASEPTIGTGARRDLRVDFVRGSALLIIFSDHIIGNPVRDFMPISLGFSDMAEVFLFLSGYLNGLRYASADHLRGMRYEVIKTVKRCLQLYGAILLMHALAVAMLAVANECGIQSVSFTDLLLPRSSTKPELWTTLTLQCLLINSCVLALYLILIPIVPFVATSLHRHPMATVAAFVGLYMSVQVWPRTMSLPQPWDEALFFNPLAWQLPFVLGMACGMGGAYSKAFIPRSLPALIAAVCGLEIAFLMKSGWLTSFEGLWVQKATLGPLRLVHFYCVLIAGRALLPSNARFLISAWLHPIIICGRRSLATYCAGGLLAVLGTVLLAEFGGTLSMILAVNVVGWIACILIAYLADALRCARS